MPGMNAGFPMMMPPMAPGVPGMPTGDANQNPMQQFMPMPGYMPMQMMFPNQ